MKLGTPTNRVQEFDARPEPRIGAFQARNSAIPAKVVADLPSFAHGRLGICDAFGHVVAYAETGPSGGGVNYSPLVAQRLPIVPAGRLTVHSQTVAHRRPATDNAGYWVSP
jgi:hypothetical protein